MASSEQRNYPSSEVIRRYYFGEGPSRSHTADPVASMPHDILTPTARYVAGKVRQRIGEINVDKVKKQLAEEELLSLIKLVEEIEGEELSEWEHNAVIAAVTKSLEHYDILQNLIDNPDVNDIIIRAYDDISIQSGRVNTQTDLRFPDHAFYKSFVENLLKRAGKACTLATPVVDAALDPQIRICVTHESFSPPGSGPMLTIRIARHQAISLQGLVRGELAPQPVLDYLAALVTSGQATILIAGEVSTGKTTLVRALASVVPNEEAILVIEDTHEISLKRQFVRTLLTREANTEGAGRIAPAEAIRTGMRMAMNRVILGEMRDAETAEAFIDVCASGHCGMSTIHARSARDAISRLELFLARAQGNVKIETIRRQIANSLSVVVYLGLDKEYKKRRLKEIVEIGSSADGVVQVSPVFSFHLEEGFPIWRRESGCSLFTTALKAQHIDLPPVGADLTLNPEELYSSYNKGKG